MDYKMKLNMNNQVKFKKITNSSCRIFKNTNV